MNGLINFNMSITLSNTYTGCRITLWYNGSAWYHYGFGITGGTLIFNVASSASYIFQVNNLSTPNMYINIGRMLSRARGAIHTNNMFIF